MSQTPTPTSSSSQSLRSRRYDRQLRLWGENGQVSLESSHVCLLGGSAVGAEALKSLVLGGIAAFTVVDGERVGARDLGENFMLSEEQCGMLRAEALTATLQGLNESVKGAFVEEQPEALLVVERRDFFKGFTVVIATQMRESDTLLLDDICRQRNIKLIMARSYGLVGTMRVSVAEHCVIEAKPDHLPVDLRLACPWTELLQYALSFSLDTLDDMHYKHVPYVVILIQALQQWEASREEGSLPTTGAELKEFKELVRGFARKGDEENIREAVSNAHRVTTRPTVPSEVGAVLNDPAAVTIDATSDDFWILVGGLRDFVSAEGGGALPLDGSLPDMTALTEYYLGLQEVFHRKAAADISSVEAHVKRRLEQVGRSGDSISTNAIRHFCKNSRCIQVLRYKSVADELAPSEMRGAAFQQLLSSETSDSCALFYILLRASDKIYASANRFPGAYDEEEENDIASLKLAATTLLSEYSISNVANLDDYVKEVCRYGGGEIHCVSAIIGALVAQEAIKLILSQYIPINGTLVYDAIHHKSCTIVV